MFNEADHAVVLTEVRNTVQFGSTTVQTVGHDIVLVRLSDVLRHASRFDNPYSIVPKLPKTIAPNAAAFLQATVALQDGHVWGAVWTEHGLPDSAQTEKGSLHRALMAKGTRLGGREVGEEAARLASGITIFLPQLTDGGKMWEFRVGDQTYQVLMVAELVGPPRQSSTGPGGMKLYDRANDYRAKRRRLIKQNATSMSGEQQRGTKENPYQLFSLSRGATTRIDEVVTRNTNVLAMSGTRVSSSTTGFRQAVRYRFLIRRVNPVPRTEHLPGKDHAARAARATTDALKTLAGRPGHDGPTTEADLPEPTVDAIGGEVVEDRDVYVPSAGVLPVGKPLPVYDFRLRNLLPRNTRVVGFDMLKRVFAAVRGTGAGRRTDRAEAVRHPGRRLDDSTKRPDFGAMLSGDGVAYTVVSTDLGSLVLPGGKVGVFDVGPGVIYGDLQSRLSLQRAEGYTDALRRTIGGDAIVTGQPAIQQDLTPRLAADLRRGATFGRLRQIAWEKNGEMEGYDQVGEQAAQSATLNVRKNTGVRFTAPIPVSPHDAIGPRVQYTHEHSDTRTVTEFFSIERRNWLRTSGAHYQLTSEVNLRIDVESGGRWGPPIETKGMVMLIVDGPGTELFGIPDEALLSARALGGDGKAAAALGKQPAPPGPVPSDDAGTTQHRVVEASTGATGSTARTRR